MRLLVLLLALVAVSCAHTQATGPRVELSSDPTRATVTRSADLQPPRCVAPKLPARPAEPAIDWLAKDCPAKFMSCLSGSDFEAMRLYRLAIQQWARDADRRCSRDR